MSNLVPGMTSVGAVGTQLQVFFLFFGIMVFGPVFVQTLVATCRIPMWLLAYPGETGLVAGEGVLP